jgi:hypothetical protein
MRWLLLGTGWAGTVERGGEPEHSGQVEVLGGMNHWTKGLMDCGTGEDWGVSQHSSLDVG